MQDLLKERINKILDMFDALEFSYKRLSDKTGIRESKVKFDGFDIHFETPYYECAQKLLSDTDDYNICDLNSHRPRMNRYTRMLNEWESLDCKFDLSREEIIKVINTK